MKLIIAVVRDEEVEEVVSALVKREFGVTRLASTGGFLRRGNSTLLVGTSEDRLDEAVESIRSSTTESAAAGQRRATLFVLNVVRFEQL